MSVVFWRPPSTGHTKKIRRRSQFFNRAGDALRALRKSITPISGGYPTDAAGFCATGAQ